MKFFTRKIEHRLIACFSIAVLLFSALYARIGYLAHFSGFTQTAQAQSKYTLTISTERGKIYDCNLTPLVDKTPKNILAVSPQPDNLQPLQDAVPYEKQETVRTLWEQGKPFLIEGTPIENIPSILNFPTPSRYQTKQIAPHIIGYQNGDGTGVTGIEKSFDPFLTADSPSTQIVYTLDGLRRGMAGIAPEIREVPPKTSGVVLSLDENIQMVVENAGNKLLEKGSIVVMDPYSGELKAVASFPDFSPLDLESSIHDTANTPMINRAFHAYSVGSTFKVVTAAAALENQIPMGETVTCTGWVNVSGQIFRCHKRSGHGEMDMLDAMKESCNPYFIHLGLTVGGDALLEMAKRFGFSQSTTFCDGIATASGTLPSEADMINPAAIANFSFGQDKLTASPVQVARMMAVIANGGYLVSPKLVLGTTTDGKTLTRDPDVAATRILSNDIAAQIQSYLIHTVMIQEGQNALPESGTTAAGKTATAQTGKFREDGTEIEQGWFAGFFPAVNPRYVVVVLAEESGFGNTTAAPVFREIVDNLHLYFPQNG